jgi:FkbM family methyltransferase
MIKEFLKEIKGINFIDVGSSGNLDPKWTQLESRINLIGFDPNAEECRRMSELPNTFQSIKYLPFAVGVDDRQHKLFKTKSIYCYSLLKPNSKWLNRFSFADLFEIKGEELIKTIPLNKIPYLKDMDVDIIKSDTQGLELPILANAGEILEKSFFVETETGFVENYLGETTYSQIDDFMRSKGFLLFDLNTSHRIARNNIFKETTTGAEQLMWCEATWLKDYIFLIEQGKMDKNHITREKALKILIICALQGCLDYGYELASCFWQLKLIDFAELASLEKENNWLLSNDSQRLIANKKEIEIKMAGQISNKFKKMFRKK